MRDFLTRGGAILAMACALPLQAADAVKGAQSFETCRGCHGIEDYVNVYPTYKVPKLAGQHEAYLISALQAYRDGETRQHSTMHANAGSLTDEDIANIAAFLAGVGK